MPDLTERLPTLSANALPLQDRQQEAPEPQFGEPGFLERRRPGRLQNPSPHLIALMRGQTDATLADRHAFIHAVTHDRCDGQQPAGQGILNGILLSIPLWIASVIVARWLLRF